MPDLGDDTGSNHVVVSGNIGAGKTALTKVLGQYFGWQTVFEEVNENPYLSDFYDDMPRWSFNLQVYFLSQRFHQLRQIEQTDSSVVQDRSIYEDAQIFARNLHEMGRMSARDYQNYVDLFSVMTEYVKAPTLLVYLRASIPTLVNQIQKRGREYETSIQIDYLERLQEHYEEWISSYDRGPKLIVDVDELDFVHDDRDQRTVLKQIESRIFGLFPDE